MRDPRTRAERFRADEEAGAERPELVPPEIDPDLSYMVRYLFTVGPSCGGEVLTFREIEAWASLTGTALTPWEAETLVRLSKTYLAEHQAASAPDRPPPGRKNAEKPKPSRSEISQRISDMFARLEERDRKKGLSPA